MISNKPYIIAEIGFNHEGDVELAGKMIAEAAANGADAVKFQSFAASDILLPSSPHFSTLETGEMNLDTHLHLKEIADNNRVDFLSTPFSRRAVDMLETVGVGAYKVASMDCTNAYLLSYIAETRKPIILSTGMATLAEIAWTLSFLQNLASGPVTLLHCLSIYPASVEDLSLEIIPFLRDIFGVKTGYSDHYPGTDACLAAYCMGAEVIETHFTLDSKQDGADHFHSVEPSQLKALTDKIALFRKMKGNKDMIHKRPDQKFAKDFRRGVYVAKNLPKGHKLMEDDLLFARPVSEFTPNDLDAFLKKTLTEDVKAYQPFEAGFINGQPKSHGDA